MNNPNFAPRTCASAFIADHLLKIAFVSALVTLFFMPRIGYGQLIGIPFPPDVKNYTTAYFPGTDNYVMGGTFFAPGSSPASNHANLIFINSNTITGSYVYAQGSAYDERVISVKTINGNMVVMVSLLRDVKVNVNEGDRILVRKIDLTGKVVSSKIVSAIQHKYNLYPMDAVVNNGDNLLYICGYTTTYAGPASPQPTPTLYLTQRHSFVLMYDLLGDVAVNSREFESTNNRGADCDMATRMKFLSNGDLFVTGAAFSGFTNVGTLMLSLNPSTLLPSFAKSVSSGTGGVPGNFPYESGFDLREAADGTGYYIFSNMTLSMATSSTDWPLSQGFAITRVDLSFNPVIGANTRAVWNTTDLTYGVNTIDGINPDPTRINTNLVLSCYGGPFSITAGGGYLHDLDHISPLLTEMNLSVNPSSKDIVVNTAFTTVIPTAIGTGNYWNTTNGFHYLGGFYSADNWPRITTARDLSTGSTDITLNAPIWDTIQNKLFLKYIRTDQYGIPLGGCPSEEHAVPVYATVPCDVAATIVDNAIVVDTKDYVLDSDPRNIDYISECNAAYFKGTVNQNNPQKTGQIRMYPNPASDKIEVDLGEISFSSASHISITDISNRTIRKIPLEGLSRLSVQTTSIPSGTYFLNVVDGRLHTTPVKFSIIH